MLPKPTIHEPRHDITMNAHSLLLRIPAPTNNPGAALRWVHENQPSRLAMQNVCRVHTAPERQAEVATQCCAPPTVFQYTPLSRFHI